MDPRQLPRRDLRRLVQDLWADPRCDAIAAPALTAALDIAAKSIDRAVVTAYLRHLPTAHPAFPALRKAVAVLAERHDWPWRERGRQWQLWDERNGPALLGRVLLDGNDPISTLRDAGFDGDLIQGAYVREAIAKACAIAQEKRGSEAETCGARLIALVQHYPPAGADLALIRALLTPWRSETPGKTYQNRLLDYFVSAFGDPRFKQSRWGALVAEANDDTLPGLISVLRRWLTERTVRQFFDAVGLTTNNAEQWAERRAFWEAYLAADLIDEAWFALGNDAEDLIKSKTSDLAGNYGLITGGRQYADPTHSSLIMSIGPLRIAEWSHSGACRFWRQDDRTAPEPYNKQYFGIQLRAMNGGEGFEYIPHHSNWQYRMAAKVYDVADVAHPVFGQGLRLKGFN